MSFGAISPVFSPDGLRSGASKACDFSWPVSVPSLPPDVPERHNPAMIAVTNGQIERFITIL
jgi:hypothetical protein